MQEMCSESGRPESFGRENMKEGSGMTVRRQTKDIIVNKNKI